jgi:hypothetical protein
MNNNIINDDIENSVGVKIGNKRIILNSKKTDIEMQELKDYLISIKKAPILTMFSDIDDKPVIKCQMNGKPCIQDLCNIEGCTIVDDIIAKLYKYEY